MNDLTLRAGAELLDAPEVGGVGYRRFRERCREKIGFDRGLERVPRALLE